MKALHLLFFLLLPVTVAGQLVDSATTESVVNHVEVVAPPGARFDQFHFYLTPLVAIPALEFRKTVHNSIGNAGIGFNAGALINPTKYPSMALLGIDFSYFNYGIQKTPETAAAPALRTSSNVFTWNATARIQPFTRTLRWSPFADGMLGVKIYNTVTKIDKDFSNIILNTNQREVINKVSHAGLNLGAGGGFIRHAKNDGADFFIRVMYWWGDDITYVVPHSIVVDANGNVGYQTAKAKTTMLVISVGVNIPTIKALGEK